MTLELVSNNEHFDEAQLAIYMERENLLKQIDDVMSELVTKGKQTAIQFFGPTRLYLQLCGDLQDEILKTETCTRQELYQFKNKLNILEVRFEKNFKMNSLVYPLLALYVLTCSLILLSTYRDIPELINKLIGIDSSSSLVIYAIIGALIYFSNEILQKINNKEIGNKQLAVLLNVSTRFFIALCVPIVLVSLFFDKDGTIGDFAVTPELLSFVCGYSITLVVDILNKLVEKVSNMIKSI